MDAPEVEEKEMTEVLLLIMLMFFPACSDRQEYRKEDVRIDEKDIQKSIEKFTLVETEGSVKKWVMNADSAEFLETDKGDVVKAVNMDVVFYEDNNTVTRLKSDSGDYNKRSQVLDLSGNVVINSQTKKVITSDVRWDPGRNLFVTDKRVEIVTESGTMKGMGMEASMDLEDIKITSGIEGQLSK
ncbi:MAG: LPS export ABC transporter periplasmic protein LptC [Elusimicrobia bacterium]|nr:LPS export ABC transporter periplasmic protein LptC [Elusimicrobiota bacterium]